MRSSLYRATPLPEWLQDGARFGETGHDLDLDRCLVKTTHVRSRIVTSFKTLKSLDVSTRHLLVPELLQCLRECLDLEASFRAWTLSSHTEYSYGVVNVEDLPRSSPNEDLFYSSTAHNYKSFMHALSWNRCRAARLVINGLINKVTHWVHIIVHPQEQVDVCSLSGHIESRNTILQLVDEICASVPFAFGATESNFTSGQYSDTTATQIYPLVWPLVFCSGALYIPEHQRAWIRAKLALIGQITGSSLIMSVAKVRQPAFEPLLSLTSQ